LLTADLIKSMGEDATWSVGGLLAKLFASGLTAEF
jgi:hypothetical protein